MQAGIEQNLLFQCQTHDNLSNVTSEVFYHSSISSMYLARI